MLRHSCNASPASLYQLVRSISLRQLTAVIARSHNFAISPCRTEGDKVATLHPIQINSLTEYIRRLADGPYDIISLNRRIRSDILYLMERLVECRTNQIRHAGIQDGKLLVGALLHIKHLRNQ